MMISFKRGGRRRELLVITVASILTDAKQTSSFKNILSFLWHKPTVAPHIQSV